jgi:tRNA A-37 threonylcarbamoyl transferase component Bud32
MTTRAACPNPACRRSYALADGLATPHARCPACRTVLTYPDTPASPTETVAAAEPTPAPAPDPVLAAPTEAGPAPQRVGRFVVLGRLGSGAFGTVYKARDPQLERDVALKVPNPGMLDTPRRVERFLREAKAAARLRHPHIVPVFDAGQDGDRYYIASAFVDGKPLSEVVGERGLKLRRAAEVVRLLAEAVGYAHEQGVVHRDIKPHNVMLDAADRPHLMDFGLAVRADEAEKLTNDGAVLGTPAYMAPEQAAGQKGEASPLSDQYSLGVLLYELLTGRTPFSGPPAAVIYRVIHHDPPAPRALRPNVPPDLETICLKAMAKRPADRYPMCRMLADDLRLWLADEPIAARRHTAAERAVRWARRNRAVAALLLVAVVSLVGGAAVATAFGLQARTRARDAEAARDDAQEAERRAEEARRKSEASEKRVAEAVDALVGERGRGKDLTEQIREYDRERQERAGDVNRLRKEAGELRGRLDELDAALPPPREIDLGLRQERDDLRAELAKSADQLKKAAVRSSPYRQLLYQQAFAALDTGAPGGDAALAAIRGIPAEQRGWEWNYILQWRRPYTIADQKLRPAGFASAAHLCPSGDRLFTAVTTGVGANTTMVLATARLVTGQDPQVTSAPFAGWSGGGFTNLVSNRDGEVTHFNTLRYSSHAYQTGPAAPADPKDSLHPTQTVYSPAGRYVAYRKATLKPWGVKDGVFWHPAWPVNAQAKDPNQGLDDLRPENTLLAVDDGGEFLAVATGNVPEKRPGKGTGREALVMTGGSVRSLATGRPVTDFPLADATAPVVFSPKSTWVAAASRGGQSGDPFAKVVCTPVRTPADAPREFVGHTRPVRVIAFSADETRMLTGGDDGTVRVWDTATTECLLTLKAGGPVSQLVMSPDGRRVVALWQDRDNFLNPYQVRMWEPKGTK